MLREDHPYCIKCYENVFANNCDECNKIIGIDSKVSQSSEVVPKVPQASLIRFRHFAFESCVRDTRLGAFDATVVC